MTCPRCSVSEISPVTGRCDLCGYSVVASVGLEPADALTEVAKGQLAHEFAFGGLIGRGKESVVYRARELGSGREVVLKAILRRNAEVEVAESFRAMMATLAGFDHPHLIPVLRHGSTDSVFWFATEYRGDLSLAAKLAIEGPLDMKACRRLLTQVVSALDYLHRHGLVHGAVKAENILIDPQGWVRLADPNFIRPRWRRPSRSAPTGGVPITPVTGKAVRPTPASGKTVRPTPSAGTPAPPPPPEPRSPWVSPEELARGERLPAADQYALAVLAIECLAGSDAENVIDPLALIGPEVPPRVRRALERALDEIPTRRYSMVTDFLWALEEDAAATHATPNRRVTTDVMMVKGWEPPPDGRRPLRILGRVVVALLVVASIALATPTARAFLWPEPAEQARAAPSPNTMTQPPAATSTAPTLEAPRPASNEPATPRTDSRDATRDRAVPPSSIAPRRPAASSTVSAPAAPPTVRPATPTPAATDAASGRLFVNASPWGQLFVDGTLIGNTPRANIPLTAGRHTIRVSRAGFASWERTITVSSGETVRFTDIVLVADRP